MIIEKAYSSLLQGVSQQLPRERPEGYVSAQVNMLSDPVTGLRRRPGSRFRYNHAYTLQHAASFTTTFTHCVQTTDHLHFFVISPGGVVEDYVFSKSGSFVRKRQQQYQYLALGSHNAHKFKVQEYRGYLWVLNTEAKPTITTNGTTLNPSDYGFLKITVGAYDKDYHCRLARIRNADGVDVSSMWFSIRTPKITDGVLDPRVDQTVYDADAFGDAVKRASPTGVAASLRQAFLETDWVRDVYDIYRNGSTLLFKYKGPDQALTSTHVSSELGDMYCQQSNRMLVALATSGLPSNMPPEANGLVCTVGSNRYNYEYYTWVAGENLWRESGTYADYSTTLSNMPLALSLDADSPVIASLNIPYDGRRAGDDENNPHPEFLEGATGLCAYQGRLGIMSPGYITFSAVGEPTKFYRRTVTTVRQDDAFSVGAEAASGAAWEYAVPFNKDLLVYSATHQAVVPALTSGFSANTAQFQLTAWQNVDTRVTPTVVGRTIVHATPTKAGAFQVEEFIPSTSTSSLYVPNRLTAHIPTFMQGSCRKIACSPSMGIACYLSDTARASIYVQQYLWAEDARIQNAFSVWEFKGCVIYDIMFVGSTLWVQATSPDGQQWSWFTIDLDQRDAVYIDMHVVAYGVQAVHHPAVSFRTNPEDLRVVFSDKLEPIAFTIGVDGTTLYIAPDTTDRSVYLGYAIESSVSPTAPVVLDRNGEVNTTANPTLLQYKITTGDAATFSVDVATPYGSDTTVQHRTNTWGASTLDPEAVNSTTQAQQIIVPVGAPSEQSTTTIRTDSAHELQILAIEYLMKIANRPTRKRL